MPNDTSSLLATVSALGLSLGVAFDVAAASPPASEAAAAAKAGHHIKLAEPPEATGRVSKVEALSIKQKVTESSDEAAQVKGSITQKAKPDPR